MPVNSAEVKRLLGDIDDSIVARIVESGATLGELEQVAAYLAQEDDVMGELRRPLTGRAEVIYGMLDQEARKWDETP